MIYRITLCCLFALLFTSCTGSKGTSDRVSDKILAKFARKMEGRGLRMVGSGGGINHRLKKINLISATFKYDGMMMDVENARCLIVDSSEVFLNLINSDPNNEQFFESFPVPSNILDLGIIGKQPEDNKVEYIEVVSLLHDKVRYLTDKIRPKIGPYTTVHEESFQKAQAIVNKEGCS